MNAMVGNGLRHHNHMGNKPPRHQCTEGENIKLRITNTQRTGCAVQCLRAITVVLPCLSLLTFHFWLLTFDFSPFPLLFPLCAFRLLWIFPDSTIHQFTIPILREPLWRKPQIRISIMTWILDLKRLSGTMCVFLWCFFEKYTLDSLPNKKQFTLLYFKTVTNW